MGDIDAASAITGIVINPGNLYRANEISTNPPLIEFSNLQAGTVASATLSFRTKNEIPNRGKFKIEFPTGFTITNDIKLTSTVFDEESVSMDAVDGNSKHRERSGLPAIPGNTTVNVYFENIGLPGTPGDVGSDIAIKTLDKDGNLIDESTSIQVPTILSTGTITANGLAISNLTAGGDPRVLNLTFILSSKIGKSNTIELTTSPGIFGSSGSINCVATVGGSSLPLTTTATSNSITATLGGSAPGTNLITLSFNSNLANNPASGTNVTYDLSVTGHSGLTSQFGYTIS